MAKAVEPFANFAAQELLKSGPSLHGWVRKDEPGRVKSALKLFEWPRRFIVLCKGCLYLYKESTDSNFCNKYPLSTYRVCNAQEITKYDWVFKLINAVEVETLYFAVDSEFDLFNWISAISKDKEEYCYPDSGGDADVGSQYCEIEDVSLAHRQRPPLRPHSRSSPGPFEAAREFQWPPSLEPRKTMQCPPPLPPREDFRRQSLPPPTGIPRNDRKTTTSHQSPSASHAFPRSCEQFPDSKSFRPPPPPRGVFGRSSSSVPSQVKMDLVIRDLRQGQGRADERGLLKRKGMQRFGYISKVNPYSNAGSSKSSGTPHREGRPITRGNPEGNSFRRPRLDNVLPPSAVRLDLSKTEVAPLLKNKVGVYILRESQTSQSKRALSVWTGEKVNHYLVYYEQRLGYALEPEKGPRFNSIENLVRHYFEYNLPNTGVKLTMPYK